MSKVKQMVGQTRSTGFQIGVRRTVPIAHEAAWQLLTSRVGVRLWLGDVEQELAKGVCYNLGDGTTGETTTFVPSSHLRVTWHPPTWPRASVIQLRVLPKGERTVVAFHQEWLPGPVEREERRLFFTAALDRIDNRE